MTRRSRSRAVRHGCQPTELSVRGRASAFDGCVQVGEVIDARASLLDGIVLIDTSIIATLIVRLDENSSLRERRAQNTEHCSTRGLVRTQLVIVPEHLEEISIGDMETTAIRSRSVQHPKFLERDQRAEIDNDWLAPVR